MQRLGLSCQWRTQFHRHRVKTGRSRSNAATGSGVPFVFKLAATIPLRRSWLPSSMKRGNFSMPSPRSIGLPSMPTMSPSAPVSFADLLGPKLTNREGASMDTLEALKDKPTVGLYFSAHWCPPCNIFTPKLVQAYEEHLKEKGLEIVFVSSDKDQEAFTGYLGQQPWLAVPFEDRVLKDALSRRYRVNGIPSLILLDSNCNIITKEARKHVMEDPTGADFPWKSTAMMDTVKMFGAKMNTGLNTVVKTGGTVVKTGGSKVNSAYKVTADTVRRAEVGDKLGRAGNKVGGSMSTVGVAIKSTAVKASKAVGDALPIKSSSGTGPTQVVLLGVGAVARELVRAVLEARPVHADQYGVNFVFRCFVDSSGSCDVAAATDDVISSLMEHKQGGNRLVSFDHPSVKFAPKNVDDGEYLINLVRQTVAKGSRVMVVDCTATDETTPALIAAVQMGAKVVSANKKPFTSTQEEYDKLVGATPRRLGAVRYESSVGAGLPVIAALTRTMTATDVVSKISGTFSGTLGYVMTGLQSNEPFSEVVKKAKSLGYTEPDPRDDLGGTDVARKALILARMLGWRLEMADVNVEPLYPEDMASLSVDEFMEQLPKLDAEFALRVAGATDKGCVLRYTAHIENEKLTVKLAEVAQDTPLGRLSGTDNLVEIYTKWYDPNPLVVQGAGAGTGTTAAGVLSDMVELAFTE